MFTHYRTQGFIVRKINLGETDQLLTIYTKDFGKLEVLGRAIRKTSSKLRSGAEIFYLSEIEFIQGKTHKTLTDAILIDKFKNLRKSLKRLATAYKISEVLDAMLKGQESDEKIWGLLNEIFEKLNNPRMPNTEYQILYYYFLWNFISILGYQQEFYLCSLCRKKLTPENIFFSPGEGGLICNICGTSIQQVKEIGPNTVKILRIILKKDWPTFKKLKIKPEDLKSLKIISDYYFSEILEQSK
jgi:DNA repair protein RecO (recombination protein O)